MAEYGGGLENCAEGESSTGTTTQEGGGGGGGGGGEVAFDIQNLLAIIKICGEELNFNGMNKYGFRFDSTVEANQICADYTGVGKKLEESRSINHHPDAIRLIPIASEGFGNCFLHSCSLFMWGVNDRDLNLRRALHQYITLEPRLRQYYDFSQRFDLIPGEEVQVPLKDLARTWDDVCNIFSERTKTKCLEAFHIFATANLLRRPIVVYGLRTDNGTIEGVFLPMLSNPENCVKSPILIGFGRSHFLPLMRRDRPNDTGGQPLWTSDSCNGHGRDPYFVPLYTESRENFGVKYIFHHQNVNNELNRYMHTFNDDYGGRYAILDDEGLPDQWRAPRPEIRLRYDQQAQTRDSTITRTRIAKINKKYSLIKAIQLAFNDNKVTPYLNNMNQNGFRFNTERYQHDSQTFDYLATAILESRAVINYLGGTCALRPLSCAGDANRMSNAISLFMWGIHDHDDVLRKKLNNTLRDEKSEIRTALQERFELFDNSPDRDRRWREVARLWSYSDMRCALKSLEMFHLFAFANALRRPIIVYSETGDPFNGVYLPLLVNPGLCIQCPVLLASTSQGLLPLMRVDKIVEGASPTTGDLITCALDANCHIQPDAYSDIVPLVNRYHDLLPVPFLLRDADPLETMRMYMEVVLLGKDPCASLNDQCLSEELQLDCPEHSSRFEKAMPTENRS